MLNVILPAQVCLEPKKNQSRPQGEKVKKEKFWTNRGLNAGPSVDASSLASKVLQNRRSTTDLYAHSEVC